MKIISKFFSIIGGVFFFILDALATTDSESEKNDHPIKKLHKDMDDGIL